MKILLMVAAAAALMAAACTPVTPPPDPGPDLCAPGTFSADGEEPCDPAPVGTFVDIEGATEATPCPPGTYQDETGQTSCDDAEPGSFVDVSGAAAPTLCPLGTFQPASAATECLLAPIGSYVDTVGATAATDCPPGETTEFEGSTSASDCFAPAATLAIAYSNLDGTAGYDDSGTDRLISRLVDTSGDGVPSAGDTIEFGEYPLDVLATGFGGFGTDSLVATAGIALPPGASGLVGVEAAGWFYTWNDHGAIPPSAPFPRDAYSEQSSLTGTPSGDPAVIITDGDDDAAGPDAVEAVTPGPPSDPDTTPVVTSAPGSTGDAFIEVEVFTP